jgi:amino acid transporter
MNLSRWPRPLMMFLAVITAILLVVFFVGIGLAVLRVYDRAATEFRPVPDMSGGIAAIIGAVALLLPAIVQFMQIFHGRHRERMDQQARGLPPSGVPFPQPAPTQPGDVPGGGMVNNQAITE